MNLNTNLETKTGFGGGNLVLKLENSLAYMLKETQDTTEELELSDLSEESDDDYESIDSVLPSLEDLFEEQGLEYTLNNISEEEDFDEANYFSSTLSDYASEEYSVYNDGEQTVEAEEEVDNFLTIDNAYDRVTFTDMYSSIAEDNYSLRLSLERDAQEFTLDWVCEVFEFDIGAEYNN